MKPDQVTIPGCEERTGVKPSDVYYTPGHVIASLLDSDRAPHRGLPIVEPCAGRGDIAAALIARGWSVPLVVEIREEEYPALEQVVYNQILLHDWLTLLRDDLVDVPDPWGVVTNPPFSLGSQFWTHCYGLGASYCAMLCRCNVIGSNTWHYAWALRPPTFIRSLIRRASFRPDGRTDAAEYMWIGWRLGDAPLDFGMV